MKFSRARFLVLSLALFVLDGCTKSTSYFFQGELVEKQPDGTTRQIPVLIEREMIADQNKIAIANHQTANGKTHHFSTVYDFTAETIEMKESGNVLSTGTFTCERNGDGLDTLTSCTYDLKTGRGDTIHGTDTYQGTQSIAFDSVLTLKKEGTEYTYSGSAESVSETEFNSLVKTRFPGGSSGCQINSAHVDAITLAIPVLALAFRLRRNRLLRR